MCKGIDIVQHFPYNNFQIRTAHRKGERKMAIMLAARICANDILNGMYCDVELKDVKSINDDYVDVQYVEADDNANY